MTEREMARKKAAARKARMERERKARNRRVVMTVALMLAVCVASVGGTIAWLTDSTEEVKNVFTPSDIGITLTETPNTDSADADNEPDTWEAQLVPGVEYRKDPTVAVDREKTDVPIYLFVEVDEGNCATYLDYDLAWDWAEENKPAEGKTPTEDEKAKLAKYDGWTELTGEGVTAGTVYYRVVNPDDATKTWELLVDNKVTVKNTVVKSGTSAADGIVVMPSVNQEMTFKAYAIQYQQFGNDVLSAWNQAKTNA